MIGGSSTSRDKREKEEHLVDDEYVTCTHFTQSPEDSLMVETN